MVFDASAPIRRKGQPVSGLSLESAAAEEAAEVEALIASRNQRLSQSSATAEKPKNLEQVYDFRVKSNNNNASNNMFVSRKGHSNSMSSVGGSSNAGSIISSAAGGSAGGVMSPGSSTGSGMIGAGSASKHRASFGTSSRPTFNFTIQRPSSPSLSSTRSSRRSNSPGRTPDDAAWRGAHRKLSEQALQHSSGSLSQLPPSALYKKQQEKDQVFKDHDPDNAIESDSESDDSSEDEDSGKKKGSGPELGRRPEERPPMSLAQAAENERLDIIRDHSARVLARQRLDYGLNAIISDNSPSATRRKQVRPNTSFMDEAHLNTPENSDEEEERDWRLRDLTILKSDPLEDDGRIICTLQRGGFVQAVERVKRTRTYVVAVDLSPQAQYALEWTIGTVMRDGDICRIVNVIEYDEREERKTAESLKLERKSCLEEIMVDAKQFLQRTRLEVKIEIEVIHHERPKHLLTEIIDTTMPTMVIIGSRGRANMTGILLGSFSNYIVNKSSVPVMVARKRLRRGGSKKRKIVLPTTVRMPNNGIATAVVD
ncbi:hypothetical protein PYCC9005_004179 [Savitreella phatthalungensis]